MSGERTVLVIDDEAPIRRLLRLTLEPQGYRIYEVGVDGKHLRQLTFPPPNEAELQRDYRVFSHYHHGTDDMQPCYLPDVGIIFTSTRCCASVPRSPPRSCARSPSTTTRRPRARSAT